MSFSLFDNSFDISYGIIAIPCERYFFDTYQEYDGCDCTYTCTNNTKCLELVITAINNVDR